MNRMPHPCTEKPSTIHMDRTHDLMTGKERALNAMLNKQTDRTSVHPAIDVSYAAKQHGMKVGECFLNPDAHARALEHVFAIHPGIDGLYVNLCLSPRSFAKRWKDGDNTYVLDHGGMTWFVPADDIGTVGAHEITELDDPRLQTANPLQDGIVDTYAAVAREIKDQYLVVPGLTGPFSQLVFMLGLSETLLLTIDQPDELKRALQWRVRKAIEWADELIRAGAECVWIGEGAASSSIISPATYAEFVLPYASQVVAHLKANGIVTVMHVCGDINPSAGIIASSGVDAMDVDSMVDLGTARAAIGRPICLRGNLSPMDLLRLPADALVGRCRQIIAAGGSPLVLSTGCLVARDTPRENLDAMVAAAVSSGCGGNWHNQVNKG